MSKRKVEAWAVVYPETDANRGDFYEIEVDKPLGVVKPARVAHLIEATELRALRRVAKAAQKMVDRWCETGATFDAPAHLTNLTSVIAACENHLKRGKR